MLPLETPGLSNLGAMPGVLPEIVVSPLLAAASRGQARATERLLELGADAREEHPLYGSALHVAAQSGSPETVQLLLAAGIPPDVKNRQGLTPRAVIQAVRNQIEMTRNMVKTMPQLQKVYDQLSAKLSSLPEAGWTACEELLRQAGG
jgi:ankyrin repeat protein